MAFAHQVGGHAATILASPLSSSTLIKPASEREFAFYQALGPSLADGHFVGDWTPAFYGTLRAHAPPENATAEPGTEAGRAMSQPDMLVLENLTHRFLRPNVLDIKLGTQLFDEEATDEKRIRMLRAAEATTSATTGVWDTRTQTYVQTDKVFGKSLRPDELDLGMARFFYPQLSPLSVAERATLAGAAQADGHTSGSAAGGATMTTASYAHPQSAPAPDQPPSLASPSTDATAFGPAPLPLDLLLIVLRTLLRRLHELIDVLSDLEVRMRGASLLVVIEGDPDALERAILRASGVSAPATQSSSSRDAAPDEAATADDDDEENGDAESVSTTDEEGNAKPETLLPLEMRLIDFAHTRDATGEGPDEGVLLGLRTVERLWADLVRRLEERERNEADSAS
ncbi:hypothetical protein JCM8202v2_003642 [Rhodotorula sphaerocarpa]